MAKEFQIEWPKLYEVISGLDTRQHNKIIVKRQAVPLIFVPGIMGSRLKQANGPMVWDPDDAWLMVKNYGLNQTNPAGRKAMIVGDSFDPDFLEVDREGQAKTNEKQFAGFPHAVERGWTSVSWSSYGDFLKALQKHDWGEEMKRVFDLPVHAYGYNWSDDNLNGGRELKEYISETIAHYKQTHICEKVILLTHSMGGLVARSACGLHGAEAEVEAVIHGVQPASGAPAAYWRMKAGFERPGSAEDAKWYHWFSSPLKSAGHKVGGTAASWVLGPDGPSVTALLANIPGGLELLPNGFYKTNAGEVGWLVLPQKDESIVRKPRADPYSEIYLARDSYWRLVNPSWLAEGAANGGKTETKDGLPVDDPWSEYEAVLALARDFHGDLGEYVHPETQQFYSEGIHTFDEVVFERQFHSWTSTGKRILKNIIGAVPGKAVTEGGKVLLGGTLSPMSAASMVVMAAVKDMDWYVNRGGFRAYVDEDDVELEKHGKREAEILYLLTLAPAKGSGDGTVPVSSGKALTGAKVTVAIGADDESWLDRGHEPIYKTKTGQKISFEAVLDVCVERIAKPRVS